MKRNTEVTATIPQQTPIPDEDPREAGWARGPKPNRRFKAVPEVTAKFQGNRFTDR